MTLPAIDRLEVLLRDCEALKFYGEVRTARDSLASENAALKAELRAMAEKCENLSRLLGLEQEAKIAAKDELDVSCKAAGDLQGQVEALQAELENLKGFQVILADGSELTLDEAIARMVAAEESLVSNRIAEGEAAIRAALEAALPALVEDRLNRLLAAEERPLEVARAVETAAWSGLRDKDTWPKWFQASVEGEVSERVGAGLDRKFQDRVEAAVERRFDALKADEWRKFVEERTGEILEAGLPGLLKVLIGDHDARCDRCGGVVHVHVGLAEIAMLLGSERSLPLTCPFGCSDPAGFFGIQPHRFLLHFSPLLAGVILKESPRRENREEGS